MINKREVLTNASFGSRVAEDEIDKLDSYFVQTEQWRQILDGSVDIIFGAKGSGKSALYSLLVAHKEMLRLGRRTLFLAAENPRGAPAFQDIATDPPVSEQQFRGLWKIYFLTLLANYLRHHLTSTNTKNSSGEQVISILTNNGLLAPSVNLVSRLRAVMEYLRKHLPSIEGGIIDPSTGIKVTGKITLAEPSSEQRENGYFSVDNLLELINKALGETKITIWLVLDRLDVAFSETPAIEGNALRALFRTYLDMLVLQNVDIKIFLRDDIWKKIVGAGFREASHVTRSLTLAWDQQLLQNLIVRRLIYNESICKLYGVTKENVLANADLQKEFFYRVFPPQIDIGPKQPNTLDWISSRTADGSKRTAPRELIHLLQCARAEQLKLYELGNSEPSGENLFDKSSIRQALPEVSKVRYEQTLCAEHPALRTYLNKLEGEKTQQTRDSLSILWKCTLDRADEIAEQLADAGFFERRRARDSTIYWIPFLYRDALRLVQGAA